MYMYYGVKKVLLLVDIMKNGMEVGEDLIHNRMHLG